MSISKSDESWMNFFSEYVSLSSTWMKLRNTWTTAWIEKTSLNLPTAGDIEREPDEPVGDGVGLIPWELGVPGAPDTPPPCPLELSLLFWPVESCKQMKRCMKLKLSFIIERVY